MGAGNAGTHLSRSLYRAGHQILCIYSRSESTAARLAEEVGSSGTSRKEAVPGEADYYLLTLPDSVIPDAVDQWKHCRGIWLHTSGAVPLKVFSELPHPSGVLYPLQTLTRQREIRMSEVPFLVEGSDPETLRRILRLAQSVSSRVHEIDSERRLFIHLAAVFANNFSNHMVYIAQELMTRGGHDATLLDPLLRETMEKILEIGAASAQTGPARRGDRGTMERHLQLLKSYPGWEKLYTFVSLDIQARKEDDQF